MYKTHCPYLDYFKRYFNDLSLRVERRLLQTGIRLAIPQPLRDPGNHMVQWLCKQAVSQSANHFRMVDCTTWVEPMGSATPVSQFEEAGGNRGPEAAAQGQSGRKAGNCGLFGLMFIFGACNCGKHATTHATGLFICHTSFIAFIASTGVKYLHKKKVPGHGLQ